MKKSFATFLLGFTGTLCIAQIPALQWQHPLSNDLSTHGREVYSTSDGGAIAVGEIQAAGGDALSHHGSRDIWVVKLDDSGNIEWERNLGSTGWDEAGAIRPTQDGGYILCGKVAEEDGDVSVLSNLGPDDMWLAKLDASGAVVWEVAYGGIPSAFLLGSELANDVGECPDGGFVAIATTNATGGDIAVDKGGWDIWVVKVDSLGDLLWEVSLGGSESDYGYAVEPMDDGGAIAMGTSYSFLNPGFSQYYLARIGSNGNLLWEHSYGGSGHEEGFGVARTADGGFIMNGWATSADGDVSGTPLMGSSDMWVVKVDTAGDIQWDLLIGSNTVDRGHDIVVGPDGNYYALGTAGENSGVVSGHHGGNGDLWVVQISPNGMFMGQQCFGNFNYSPGAAMDINASGELFLVGEVNGNGGDVSGNWPNSALDMWVVKLGAIAALVPENSAKTMELNVFPNPSTSMVHVEVPEAGWLEIQDINGRSVQLVRVLQGWFELDVHGLSVGSYNLIVHGEQRAMARFLKQ